MHDVRPWVLGTMIMAAGGCSDLFRFGDYAAVCQPGLSQPCHSAANEGRVGVGACKKGVQVCDPDGTKWGPCEGEVIPRSEDCSTVEDEDCDGETIDADEGCVCQPGVETRCYAGPEGVAGVGACWRGTQVCDALGKEHSECLGSVLPSREVCATASGVDGDENCDGESACLGDCGWSWSLGTQTSSGDNTDAVEVAVDKQGNLLVTGRYKGDILSAENVDLESKGLFLAKIDPKGELVWSQVFDNVLWSGRSIAVDSHDDILVTGCFQGPGPLGLCGDPAPGESGGNTFVLKISSNGDCLWSKTVGTSCTFALGQRVLVDKDDNVVLGGAFGGTFAEPGAPPPMNGQDVFVAKYDGDDGHSLWIQRFASSVYQRPRNVAVDKNGYFFVVGQFYETITLGNCPALAGAGSEDVFVAKLDPSGACVWSTSFGTDGAEGVDDIVVDDSGDAWITGRYSKPLVLGNFSLTNVGDANVYLAKLSGGNGSALWAKGYEGGIKGTDSDADGLLIGQFLAVDGDNLLVGSNLRDAPIDFGGGALGKNGSLVIAKLHLDPADPAPEHVWSHSYDGWVVADRIAVDSLGNPLLAGRFNGNVDFGCGPIKSSFGGYDLFVTKLHP